MRTTGAEGTVAAHAHMARAIRFEKLGVRVNLMLARHSKEGLPASWLSMHIANM